MFVENKTIEMLRVEIAKLALVPHDCLVINFPRKITIQEAAHMANIIQQMLPNIKVLISSEGTALTSFLSLDILATDARLSVGKYGRCIHRA